MKTKTVNTAEVVLELYDTKFVMKSEDLESGKWEMNISYTTPPALTKTYFIEDFFTEDEGEMSERMWEQVFWFIQKYHRGSDITLATYEVEDED